MFGTILKRLRTENNLSQDELGKILNVRKSSISNWETNHSTPSFEIVKKIAEFFNTSTDYLLGFDKDDLEKIEKLKTVLRENGLMVNDDLSIESLNKALQIVEVLDKDNKDVN